MVYVAGGTAMTGTPREMTGADIRQAIADFRNAAQIALDAGFDGIQLQAGFVYLIQQFMHKLTNLRTDEYGGNIENRARFLFEVLEAVLEVWPSNRVGVKTGPMMNERGLFTAVDSTLPTFEYVYDKLSTYDLSHVFLMRQMADLSGTPIAALAGDALIHHFRKIYHGRMILNVGITREHASDLISAGLGDFIAFGREYIANPDLVERIRLHASFNEQRPNGNYGETALGYTDYPFLPHNAEPVRSGAMEEHSHEI
jgi:N-ethylmaleimide reductase